MQKKKNLVVGHFNSVFVLDDSVFSLFEYFLQFLIVVNSLCLSHFHF